MTKRKIKKFEGRMYFSLRDAAEYTGTSLGTFRHHVYSQRRIHGALIGRTKIFTREQLDDYVANDRRTDIGPGRFTVDDAALYLDVEPEDVEQAVEEGRLTGVEYGGNLLFTQNQLDDFKANGRTDLDPDPIPYFATVEAADYAGLDENALKQHIHILKNLESELVGAARVISREKLEHFIATKRPQGRPPGSD